jgi:hypothetical protein
MWRGVRVTLACAHMMLEAYGTAQNFLEMPGTWRVCHTCPVRLDPAAGKTWPRRMITGAELVVLPREPDWAGTAHR